MGLLEGVQFRTHFSICRIELMGIDWLTILFQFLISGQFSFSATYFLPSTELRENPLFGTGIGLYS